MGSEALKVSAILLLLASVAVALATWVPIEKAYFTGLEFLEVGEVVTVGDFSGGGAFWYPIPEVVIRYRQNLWVVDVLSKSYKNTTVGNGRGVGIWVCANEGSVVDYGYWYIEQPDYYTYVIRFLDRDFNELGSYTYDFPAVEPGGIGDNVIFLSLTISGPFYDHFTAIKVECTPQFSISVRRVSVLLPIGYYFNGKPLAIGYRPTLIFAVVEDPEGKYGIAYNVVSDIMTATTVELGYLTQFDYSYGIPLYGYIEDGRAVIGIARGSWVEVYTIDLSTLAYETTTITTNLPLADYISDPGLTGVITKEWLAYYTMSGGAGVHFIGTQVPMRIPWYMVNPNVYSLGASYKYNAIPTIKTMLVDGSVKQLAGVLLLHTEPIKLGETITITKYSTTTEVIPIPIVETVTETITVTTTAGGIVELPLPILLLLLVLGTVFVILVARRS